ncbi:hypothetical protein ACHMW5_11720 [Azospirillum melinis]|uniref:hypothetical protein n=1 Tax=Azospirillum melinis TaxID=328839 RepID=UPI003757C78E
MAATARLARRVMVAGLSVAIVVTPFTVSLTDTVPTDDGVRDALITMLKQVAPKERLEQQIASALDRDAPEEAEDYLDVADLLQMPVDPALRTRFADENSGLRAAERNIRRAAMGFVTGEGEGTVGMAAAIASDFTVVGDIRDLTEQASRIVRDEPVDDLVLGLSIAGVSMSAATVVTAGGALPIKTGISLAKLAKKTGKLTARFQDELSWIVARAVNTSAFSAIGGWDPLVPGRRSGESRPQPRRPCRHEGGSERTCVGNPGQQGDVALQNPCHPAPCRQRQGIARCRACGKSPGKAGKRRIPPCRKARVFGDGPYRKNHREADIGPDRRHPWRNDVPDRPLHQGEIGDAPMAWAPLEAVFSEGQGGMIRHMLSVGCGEPDGPASRQWCRRGSHLPCQHGSLWS